MKRFFLVLALMAFGGTSQAKVVCDKVRVDSAFSPSGKTWASQNCKYIKGEIDPYYGPTAQEGDISRIVKNLDGSISVYRYGNGSNSEDYREVSPGEWKRVH